MNTCFSCCYLVKASKPFDKGKGFLVITTTVTAVDVLLQGLYLGPVSWTDIVGEWWVGGLWVVKWCMIKWELVTFGE